MGFWVQTRGRGERKTKSQGSRGKPRVPKNNSGETPECRRQWGDRRAVNVTRTRGRSPCPLKTSLGNFGRDSARVAGRRCVVFRFGGRGVNANVYLAVFSNE